MDTKKRTQRRGVAGNNNQLGFPGSKSLQSALVSQGHYVECRVSIEPFELGAHG